MSQDAVFCKPWDTHTSVFVKYETTSLKVRNFLVRGPEDTRVRYLHQKCNYFPARNLKFASVRKNLWFFHIVPHFEGTSVVLTKRIVFLRITLKKSISIVSEISTDMCFYFTQDWIEIIDSLKKWAGVFEIMEILRVY